MRCILIEAANALPLNTGNQIAKRTTKYFSNEPNINAALQNLTVLSIKFKPAVVKRGMR
jgi:hypothetical protein